MRNFFFFNDTATTEIYTLSLHDALPILFEFVWLFFYIIKIPGGLTVGNGGGIKFSKIAVIDRKSTRLNSSHIPLSRMPSSA